MSTREDALWMRLGRSLKLRDLHTLTVVAELGSMAKAARFCRSLSLPFRRRSPT